jgi:hypothetical protein
MPELQNRIPRIKRHIFHIVFHRGRAPRQVKRQFALWLRNAKDNIEESVSRAAVVTKKCARTLSNLRNRSRTVEIDVDDRRDCVVDGLLTRLFGGIELQSTPILSGREAAGAWTSSGGGFKAQKGVVGLSGRREDGETAAGEECRVEALDVEACAGSNGLEWQNVVLVL